MQHAGIVRRRLAIDRALLRLAMMDLQRLVGKALADMFGILADMPVQGRHHEFGFIPSYTFQSGKLKDTKVTFIAMWHNGSAHYSDATNREYRLVVNVPLHAF